MRSIHGRYFPLYLRLLCSVKSLVLVPKIIIRDTQELIPLYYFCQRNNVQSSLTKAVYLATPFLETLTT